MNSMKSEELIIARTRQANADAALKELRYREKSGELVNREEFLKEIQGEIDDLKVRIKSKILGIESLAPQLAGLEAVEIARILHRTSREILDELASNVG